MNPPDVRFGRRELLLMVAGAAAGRAEAYPTRDQLEAAYQGLRATGHGPDARGARQRYMNVIQSAADLLEAAEYTEYRTSAREKPSEADRMEKSKPVLGYLARCTSAAIDEVERTRVESGIVVWHFYNMGYVFRSPDACWGVDLHLRDGKRLAGLLDFLLNTHEHGDHHDRGLMDAMMERKKPVVTRWYPGSTLILEPAEMRFGSVRVKIDIGDHHHDRPSGLNNMLMFQMDSIQRDRTWTIYHSGDGSNHLKMTPDREPDLFIPHVQVGLDIPAAIEHLRAKDTLVSHILELSHSRVPPRAYRWSYEVAWYTIRKAPVERVKILTWGEHVRLGPPGQG